MSTAQIPKLTWTDLGEDLEAFARSAEEEWRHMSSYPLIPALDPAPVPPTLRLPPIPLPPVTPGYDTRGHRDVYDGGGDNRGDDNFPGGGLNYYQSTEQWTNASTEQAEASTSLATTKPIIIENNVQSESNSPTTSSSKGGYDRTRNAEEKKRRFVLICEALGIAWTGDELQVLQRAIQQLGGTIPVIVGQIPGATKTQEQGRKRRVRKNHFEELARLTGFLADRIAELKVLDKVLEQLTDQGGGPSGSGGAYGAFRLQ